MKLTISGFQIDEVAETDIQESDLDFLKDELGLICNWNLQAITINISTKLQNHTNLREHKSTPIFKSRKGNSALEILLDTLVASINYKNGKSPGNATELILDLKTSEEWSNNIIGFFKAVYSVTKGRSLIIAKSGGWNSSRVALR